MMRTLALLLAFAFAPLACATEYSGVDNTLASPLVLSAQNGNVLKGQSRAVLCNTGQRGPDATWLTYTGAGTAITIPGSETRLEHFSLHGATWTAYNTWLLGGAEPDWPPVGIQINHSAGLASGRITANSINVQGFDVGLKIGSTVDEAQCAESDWRSFWFLDCGTAVLAVNGQGIGHRFQGIRANGCDKIFHFQGGGKWLCDGLFTATANTTLLHLDPQGVSSIAHNNSSYELRDVFLDSQAINPTILEMEDWDYSGSVVLARGKLSSSDDYTEPIFDLAGNASVTIRDYEHLRAGFIVWHNTTHTTRLLIENCAIVGDPLAIFDASGSTGQLIVIIRNCYDATGARVPYKSRLLTGTAP